MSEGGEPDGCSPYCPAVRPARPGPLLIYPGDLIGYGKLRELALPPHAHDPSVKFHDLYDKLATIKCAGLVLNDTLPGEPDFDRWGLPTEGTLRPLFGLWTCENAFNSDLHDRVAGAVTHLLNTVSYGLANVVGRYRSTPVRLDAGVGGRALTPDTRAFALQHRSGTVTAAPCSQGDVRAALAR